MNTIVLDGLQRLTRATRKLAGARWDLTRQDAHPNDIHKALVKIEEAEELIAEAMKDLRIGGAAS